MRKRRDMARRRKSMKKRRSTMNIPKLLCNIRSRERKMRNMVLRNLLLMLDQLLRSLQ